MNRLQAPSRRDQSSVLSRAVVVASISALPIAMVSLLAPLFVQALLDGAGLGQAWSATSPTDEDWEMIPFFLGGAALVGCLVGSATAAVWLFSSARAPGRSGFARTLAAVVTGVLTGLANFGGTWPIAASAALLAGLITLIAAPFVGYHRQPRTPLVAQDPGADGRATSDESA